ncbi:MAG: hypothetical protein VX641_05490 [Planctomycetota bacterium]|nr:hypothetical protein [Planctomycetota bacterium]
MKVSLIGTGLTILMGCQTGGSSARSIATEANPDVAFEIEVERCALSRQTLPSQPAVRIFAGETIRFRSEAEATAFDELPGERKRVIAGQQVLARRGVANARCPVTQDPLPIDAEVIRYEGVPLGFTSAEQSMRFQALPTEVQIRMVARHLLRSDGISNDRCPISDLVLLPGSPTLQVADHRIAFADQASLLQYQTMPSPRQNEIAARILMPERGVRNTTCPITRQPIRLDSPVVTIDGRSIALRNVQAARTFNGMPASEQRAMVVDGSF